MSNSFNTSFVMKKLDMLTEQPDWIAGCPPWPPLSCSPSFRGSTEVSNTPFSFSGAQATISDRCVVEACKEFFKMGCSLCEPPAIRKPAKPCTLSDGGPCAACTKMKLLRARIKGAREKLLRAQKEMDDLVKEYQEVLPEMNQAHDPMLKRLPLELISSIFRFYAPPIPADRVPTGDGLDVDAWDETASRFVLGSVCRGWRRAAMCTPQLWNYILVWLGSSHLSTRDVEITQELFTRSGKLPLSIRVYCGDPPEISEGAQDMIRLLNQESSRWQILDLRVPVEIIRQFIGGHSGHTVFPMLESLRLEQERRSLEEVGFVTRDAAPKLVDVCLSRIPSKPTKIQWGNITRATLEYPCVDECLELFRNSPQLRDCKLTHIWSGSDQTLITMWSREIVHRQIEDLAIEWAEVGDFSDFLNRINCPSLKRLTVMAGEEGRGGNALTSFLKRSSCPLEKLFLVDTVWDTDDLVQVLNQVPSLLELEIESDGLPQSDGNLSPDPLFKSLARPLPAIGPSPLQNTTDVPEIPFLPKLQFFHFEILQTFSWALLPPIFGYLSENGIDNRPTRPLKTFRIHGHCTTRKSTPHMDKKTTLELLAVRASGVTLDLYQYEDHLRVSAERHGLPY